MLELARGKFFCTFSSDDIMPPDRLKKQSDYLLSHPNAVACFGQVKPMSEDGVVSEQVNPAYMKAVPEIRFEEFLLGLKPLHGCAEMFVTDAVRRLGGYDTRFFFEDYPLYLKVLYECGPQPVLPDVVCCHYREHGDNMHANHNRMYTEILRIVELYKDHKLYSQAVRNWKANWFSSLAYSQKGEALKRLPQLASFSTAFLKRLPKLFIPSRFLKQ
jgi:alpha-1,3-rhamnosyltransferase